MNRINGIAMAVGIALIALATGCAAPARTLDSASSAALVGTWRGYYRQVNAGNTGHVHGDIELRINEDGTYVGTWSSQQVAGSTRTGSTNMAGKVVVNGSQVILQDWRHLSLKRDGDMLYGLTMAPGTALTLSVYLEKVP
jgi:hypothetical protein